MAHAIIKELQQLIPQFCRLSFDTAAWISALGDALPRSARGREVVKPRGISADQCELERCDLPYARQFLTTLELKWQHAQVVRLADLEEAFGECRINRSLAIVGPSYYTFQIDDQPLPALVQFTVDSQDRRGQLTFNQVALIRMPPDPQDISPQPAVRFVIFADLSATEDISDRVPLSTTLRSAADLKELIDRLQPMVVLNVANHLDHSRQLLHVHFHLSSLDDFQFDNLLRSLPAGTALLKLRHRIAAAHSGKRPWNAVTDALASDDLPQQWRQAAEDTLANPDARAEDFLQQLDRALSAQCDAITGDPSFQAFQSAWLGLAYLVAHFDFSHGSQIEVFSARHSSMLDVTQQGFVHPELQHRTRLLPAVVIADTQFGSADAQLCRQWSNLAEKLRVPVFVSGAAAIESLAKELGNTAHEGYLGSVGDELCVRGVGHESSARGFAYQISPTSVRTECWTSGIWAIGAHAAQGITVSGRINMGQSLAPPFMSERVAMWIRPDKSLRAANEPLVARLGLYHGVAHVLRLRGIAEGEQSAAGMHAKLVLSPVLQFALRWQHQHAHRRDFSTLVSLFTATANERFADTIIEAEFDRPAGKHLLVRVTPKYLLRDTPLTWQLAIPWTEGTQA